MKDNIFPILLALVLFFGMNSFAGVTVKPNGTVTPGTPITIRITLDPGKTSVNIQMWLDVNGSKRADKGDTLTWKTRAVDGVTSGLSPDRSPEEQVIEISFRISERFDAGEYIIRAPYDNDLFARGVVLTIAKKTESAWKYGGRVIRGSAGDPPPLHDLMLRYDPGTATGKLKDTDLFLLDPVSLKTTSLTTYGYCSSPSVSFDGKHIAYIHHLKDKTLLCSMTLEKNGKVSGRKELASAIEENKTISSPMWARNTDRIAYISGNRVFITDSAGKQSRELTRLENALKILTWSKDGKSIIAAAKPSADIPVLTMDGKLLKADDKALSPEDRNKPELWKIDANTGEKERIAYDDSYFWVPYLSPDGSQFIFPGGEKGNVLWLKKGADFDITQPITMGTDAAWLPTGNKVIIEAVKEKKE